MRNIDNSISLEEAAASRGVSKRRITQQVSEGGWGIRKVARGRYLLNEKEKSVKKELTDDKLNRIMAEQQTPKFNDEDRPLNDKEIDWLLNSACYQVGIVSSDDLKAMGNSLKKSYNALRNFGDLNELKLEESAWSFMALDSIFGLWEHRKARGDRRVIIAGNTGLSRK